MGKYVRESDTWYFVFYENKEKVTDAETLKKLKAVSGSSIELFDLWSR